MAPVADNLTMRVYLDYTSMGEEHTLLLRPASTLNASAVGVLANGWASILSNRMLNTDSVFGVRYSNPLEDFSIPILYTPVPGVVTAAANLWTEDPESAFLSFVARSTTTGRRGRYTFFTPIRTTDWPADNRYSPGESAPIDTLRTNIQNAVSIGTPGSVPLLNADGTFQTVYSYVNIGKNSYWQRKQR